MVQGYSKTDLCGVGFAPEQAEYLTLRVASAVAATGSVLSQAATNNADIVYIGSVHVGTNDGFMIRDANAFSRRQVVINGTSSILKLYPPSASASLNKQAQGASFSLASGIAAEIDAISSTEFWARKQG